MKKCILTIAMVIGISTIISGCGYDNVSTVNVNNGDKTLSREVGVDILVSINDSLYYDPNTKIVYFWNGNVVSNWATVPTPYYAPNGLPYKYNVETNTFEEIMED